MNDNGIFITDKIRCAFGRRRAFLIQYLLNRFKQATKNKQLINGYVFIPDEDLQENSDYSPNTSMRVIENFKKYEFIFVETFNAEGGKFYKFDIDKLNNIIIPDFIKHTVETRINSQKQQKETES